MSTRNMFSWRNKKIITGTPSFLELSVPVLVKLSSCELESLQLGTDFLNIIKCSLGKSIILLPYQLMNC